MGRRSKVLTLPAEVKQWLDAALVEGNFTGYQLLADECKARGVAISKSSLQRYGAPFELLMAKVKVSGEQAQALMSEAGDDKGAMNDALIRIIQQKTFEVLLTENLVPDAGGTVPVSLATDPKFVRAIATLVRASVTQKDWAAAFQAKLAAKFDALENEANTADGKAKGLSPDTLRRIRQEVYGLV
jgi:hypothetical protein